MNVNTSDEKGKKKGQNLFKTCLIKENKKGTETNNDLKTFYPQAGC